eukprot:1157969-Pelagomonas_calceolata.AAC.18
MLQRIISNLDGVRGGCVHAQEKMINLDCTILMLLVFIYDCALWTMFPVCEKGAHADRAAAIFCTSLLQVPPLLLAAYAMAEALFPLAWKHKYNRFNRVPEPHAPSHPNFNPR